MTLSKGGSPLPPPLPPAHPPAPLPLLLLPLLHPLLLVALLLLLARNKGTSMAPEVVRTPTIVFQPVRVETMPDSRKPLQYHCHYQIVSSVSVLLQTSKKNKALKSIPSQALLALESLQYLYSCSTRGARKARA